MGWRTTKWIVLGYLLSASTAWVEIRAPSSRSTLPVTSAPVTSATLTTSATSGELVSFAKVTHATVRDAARSDLMDLSCTRFVGECDLPTAKGAFRLRAYRCGSSEPIVVIKGNVSGHDTLVRVHDQCFTSEVLGSLRCDCKQQLDASFDLIEAEGRGAIVYLQQEGRGIGLANKVAAYGLQDGPHGLDTVEANHELGFNNELRSYECVPAILRDLQVESVRLLTNNPFKVASLEALGVHVAARLPLHAQGPPHALHDASRAYLRTKALRMAHIIPSEVYAPSSSLSLPALLTPLPLAPVRHPSSTFPATKSGAEAKSKEEAEAAAEATARSQVFVNPTSGREHRWTHLGRGPVEAAIAALGRGEAVVVTDDEGRENEGDLIMAAKYATTERMAFVVRHTGGVVCCALPRARLDALRIPPMVAVNEDAKGTAFGVSVDASAAHSDVESGFSTGISAADRAATLRLLADPSATPAHFRRPGHVFPLSAREGGVLSRDGHTEAAVDLCRLAGAGEAGVLSEVVTADSTGMARMPELAAFCEAHGLVLTTIEDLICYRLCEGV